MRALPGWVAAAALIAAAQAAEELHVRQVRIFQQQQQQQQWVPWQQTLLQGQHPPQRQPLKQLEQQQQLRRQLNEQPPPPSPEPQPPPPPSPSPPEPSPPPPPPPSPHEPEPSPPPPPSPDQPEPSPPPPPLPSRPEPSPPPPSPSPPPIAPQPSPPPPAASWSTTASDVSDGITSLLSPTDGTFILGLSLLLCVSLLTGALLVMKRWVGLVRSRAPVNGSNAAQDEGGNLERTTSSSQNSWRCADRKSHRPKSAVGRQPRAGRTTEAVEGIELYKQGDERQSRRLVDADAAKLLQNEKSDPRCQP